MAGAEPSAERQRQEVHLQIQLQLEQLRQMQRQHQQLQQLLSAGTAASPWMSAHAASPAAPPAASRPDAAPAFLTPGPPSKAVAALTAPAFVMSPSTAAQAAAGHVRQAAPAAKRPRPEGGFGGVGSAAPQVKRQSVGLAMPLPQPALAAAMASAAAPAAPAAPVGLSKPSPAPAFLPRRVAAQSHDACVVVAAKARPRPRQVKHHAIEATEPYHAVIVCGTPPAYKALWFPGESAHSDDLMTAPTRMKLLSAWLGGEVHVFYAKHAPHQPLLRANEVARRLGVSGSGLGMRLARSKARKGSGVFQAVGYERKAEAHLATGPGALKTGGYFLTLPAVLKLAHYYDVKSADTVGLGDLLSAGSAKAGGEQQ